jgi:hypothetical protein
MYTGASHTRLEHSLGVSFLLSKLASDTDDKDKVVLNIIGLLHDIGHSGWGHALDGISSRLVSEILRIAGQGKFPIFSPKKMDMVVTSYLLLHNDQLTSALERIAKSISPWQALPLSDHVESLRDFVAWVISEEEDGNLQYCKMWQNEAHQVQNLAHYYQHLLGFDVNADRLDWIERDAHHAFSSAEFGQRDDVRSFGKSKNQLKFKQSASSPGRAESSTPDEWEKFKKIQDELREMLYASVYEGIPRSFMDSLLTRAVYASIMVLSTVGDQIASPSAKARVIMGYVFSPDAQLRSYTQDILTSAYYSGSLSLDLPTASDQFVKNTSRLWSYLFENLRMVLSLLKRPTSSAQQILSSLKTAGNIRINDKKYTIMYLDGLWLTSVLGTVETWVKSARAGAMLSAWHALSEYLWNLRTDIIRAFYTEEIEQKINDSEDFGQAKVYILPNYYFLRRITDRMPKDFIEKYDGSKPIISGFIEYLESDYVDLPMVFVVIEGDVEDKVLAKMMQSVDSSLSSHLQRSIGDKISEVLNPSKESLAVTK